MTAPLATSLKCTQKNRKWKWFITIQVQNAQAQLPAVKVKATATMTLIARLVLSVPKEMEILQIQLWAWKTIQKKFDILLAMIPFLEEILCQVKISIAGVEALNAQIKVLDAIVSRATLFTMELRRQILQKDFLMDLLTLLRTIIQILWLKLES